MRTVLAAPWAPPEPRQLPDWRARMLEYRKSERAHFDLSMAIAGGNANMLPVFPLAKQSMESMAAATMSAAEAFRLAKARLYYASDDMTSLALAVGATVPTEPVKAIRPPVPVGLMVFAEPIGGYEQSLTQALGERGVSDLSVTTPIVAVSWSPWRADQIDGVVLNRQPMHWIHNKLEGPEIIGHDAPEGIWLTFYSPGGSALETLPHETVISHRPDGTPVRVMDVIASNQGVSTPLQWDNEMVLFPDAPWQDPVPPDSTQAWAQVLYTAWQCMRQTTGRRALTEVEELPRDRAARKRDARCDHPTDDNTVRIVRVHTNHRPGRQAAADDAAVSTGRRAPDWSHRWPVPPHRRRHCMNPALHRSGGCEHEDIIVPFHVKGPADKPLVVRETVHLWDQMPDDVSG